MSTRRFFNRREHAALYIAADGKCQSCGTALQPGWHADHVQPHSKGGATDLVNGSALCAACNLQKGSRTIMAELRPWQQQALEHYIDANKIDYLAVACPGAGKTTWALTVAKTYLERGAIGRVIVVVPSDALRTQWSDHTGAGVDLRPYTDGPIDKDGYDGIVTTYQAICNGLTGGLIRNAIGATDNRRTLVILDEIHHAADTSSYGEALRFAIENATQRLLLTGTPWRTDSREQMPFVEFDENNMLKVDYSYDYGEAVADGACRRIDFPIVDAQASWMRDFERREADVTVNRQLVGLDKSDSLRAILDPSESGKWFKDVILRAHRDLLSIRREIPDAAGLIVAKDKNHAKKVARQLRNLTGVNAPVVVSAEDKGNSGDARAIIERFRSSSDPWIIAVKMIAEGVDIPRLMVGIYATNVSTSMFFNQVVGRFVRVRPGEKVTSRLYVPPSFDLWAIIREIQRMLPQRLDDSAPNDCQRDGATAAPTLPADYQSLGSDSNGLSLVHTHDGDVAGDLSDAWGKFLDLHGIPTHYATQAAASGVQPPAQVAVLEKVVPRHRREAELRSEIKDLVGRVAYHCYSNHAAAGEVNRAIYRRFGCSRDEMSLNDLESTRDLLMDALSSGVTL